MGNIILIGFMGTGKTTIGKALAEVLQWPFVDTDQCIEERYGSIPELFSFGEDYFRDKEAQVFRQILIGTKQVVSTGGGIVLRAENRQLLKEAAQRGDAVVWLWADPETIWQRVRQDNSRPLLAVEDPQERIKELLQERTELYRSVATMAIDTGAMTVRQVIQEIFAARVKER